MWCVMLYTAYIYIYKTSTKSGVYPSERWKTVIIAADFAEGDDKSAQEHYAIAAHKTNADVIEAENTCALAPNHNFS